VVILGHFLLSRCRVSDQIRTINPETLRLIVHTNCDVEISHNILMSRIRQVSKRKNHQHLPQTLYILALPQSGRLTIVMLTCWVWGTDPSFVDSPVSPIWQNQIHQSSAQIFFVFFLSSRARFFCHQGIFKLLHRLITYHLSQQLADQSTRKKKTILV